MDTKLQTSDIYFTRASAALCAKGLIGWVAATLGDLRLDGIQVRRARDGHHYLSWPQRRWRGGQSHIVYPRDDAARVHLEREIIGELQRRGVFP